MPARKNTNLPKGIYLTSSNKFRVAFNRKGGNLFLGHYDTLDEAKEVLEKCLEIYPNVFGGTAGRPIKSFEQKKKIAIDKVRKLLTKESENG